MANTPVSSFAALEDGLNGIQVPQKCLTWDNVSYTVKKNKIDKVILNNVNGMVKPGEILAIMGPSGCGKTTLLDVLADRVASGTVDGHICVNGAERGKNFRYYASYVPQEDSLMGCFTVEETLNYAADLSLPKDSTLKGRRERVQQVIAAMGLESCAKTRVGDIFSKGISGGQKRRLSIAIELLPKPSILLLDEPTSGLDSASTFSVMTYVKKLADSKQTILLTIHQPSSALWTLFSSVLFLSEGREMYFGDPSEAIAHFALIGYECPKYSNPSEYFLGLINTDFEGHADTDAIAKSYKRSEQHERLIAALRPDGHSGEADDVFHFPSGIQQFFVLTKRNLQNNARNPGIFWVRIFMYICLSFMVGTMYLRTKSDITSKDLIPMLFYVQAFLVFMSVAVLPFFIEQRAIFVRERANGSLNVGSYVVSNFISILPGIALIALISTGLVVGLAGLNGFGYFFLNLFLSLVVAESLMHVIAAAVPHYIIGIAVGAGIFGMFMLCEGFMVPKNSIPGYWIWAYYIGFHSYSFAAFMVNQFQNDDDAFRGTGQIEKYYNLENVSIPKNMAILAGYALILQIIFFFLLYKFHTGKR